MKTFLIANNKGGVGKTPVAYYLALRWAAQGKRVSVIDLDGQCNLSDMIAPGQCSQPTIVDVLSNRAGLDDALTGALISTGERISLVRATPDLYDLETELSSGLGVMRLATALRKAAGSLGDVVILDTPPDLKAMTLSGIIATGLLGGWVIVPARPDAHSVGGIKSIQSRINDAKQIPGCLPVLLGVVATQVRATNIHRQWLSALRSPLYPPLLAETLLRGGELVDYELRKAYSPIADLIWTMTGDV